MLENSYAKVSCQLTVAPSTALIDEPLTIRVTALSPHQPVLLRAQTHDDVDQLWESQALFLADANGEIDVSQQSPHSGSYQGIDPQGLLWSMAVPGDTRARTPFVKTTPRPLRVTIQAEADGQILSVATAERAFMAPGVIRRPIDERGLIATFFKPLGPGPYQGVIVLNGSDGGMHEEAAALLASHGYASLALAYFKGPNARQGLPPYLVNIPLEYFETAIQWLLAQDGVEQKGVVVLGHSRGGELALLLGTIFPQIRAVIAGSPASTSNCGITTMAVNKPAWLYRNQPIPYLILTLSLPDIANVIWKRVTRTPLALRPFFMKALRRTDKVEAAAICVEKIQGPILLISGQADQVWPAALFAEQIIGRLKRYQHPYPYEHLTYPDAGHMLCSPYGHPSLPPLLNFWAGNTFAAGGGKVEAQARATVHTWHQILEFLQRLR